MSRRLQPGQVVDRGQRRPLPAGGHIGGAEVEGDGHADSPRQPGPVAELDRAAGDAVLRPLVEHGLAVHAHEVDVAPAQVVLGQEGFGGGQVLLHHRQGGGCE